jgi:5-(carboxyamino)imidazole ribonucleotide synthase
MMLLPGSVIAILGDGQLGRMMAIEARRMGYTVWTVGPNAQGPAAQLADKHICLPLDAAEEIANALRHADVATFETEHVPLATLVAVELNVPVRPDLNLLSILQDRLSQKVFLESMGLPVAAFFAVNTREDLWAAADELHFPFILKTRHGGYDGKGQFKFTSPADINSSHGPAALWVNAGSPPAVAEAFVPFETEVSVVLGRDSQGTIAAYPVAQNNHRHHVLRTTTAPADLSESVAQKAAELAQTLAHRSAYVGVMALEMFVLGSGQLLINEVAPRVHNSGHHTLGGAVTSQFEQHIRAICGLPLGSTETTEALAMANLLGDLWQHGAPDFATLLSVPNVQLHLYGKGAPAPGRKMGHFLVRAANTQTAHQQAEALLTALENATPATTMAASA